MGTKSGNTEGVALFQSQWMSKRIELSKLCFAFLKTFHFIQVQQPVIEQMFNLADKTK